MSVSLPNGSTVAIASGYGSPVTITAITNANPGVASATAHGFSDGDYVEITSGWSKLTERVVRVDDSITDAFDLEGVDTTSTSMYPSGGGAGSARKITGWTQLAQITDSSSEGGEQQFLTYQFLESDSEKRIPTTKTAAGITFTVADDPTLPGYILAKQANDDRLPRALLVTLSNGGKLLYNAYISLSVIPSLTVNQLMTVQVTLSLLGDPVRYSS
ncbi:phage tail protein [Xenophilus sp.]|uniref:phage tail protein n=1 Tax=Xenophilus sp. TaxID=1873499 RepID=UPI0037DD65BF